MFGFNFDEVETLRPFGSALWGSGGRWGSKGDIRPLTTDGRRPGCEEARLRPGVGAAPELEGEVGILTGGCVNEDGGFDSVGDEEVVEGGADILLRR